MYIYKGASYSICLTDLLDHKQQMLFFCKKNGCLIRFVRFFRCLMTEKSNTGECLTIIPLLICLIKQRNIVWLLDEN